MKASTSTWIILILLTATSYTISGGSAAGFVLAAAGLKAGLVGWQFMELRHAHPLWWIALFSVLATVLGLVFVLVPNG